MNLAAWAERNGVARVTAYRWLHAGLLPVPARKVGRLILVDELANGAGAQPKTAVYARVSSAEKSMCARLVGKRAAQNRAKRAVAAAAVDDREAA